MTQDSTSNSFLLQAKSAVLENISNEQFGVSELASKMNMSRSSLLRKIKKQNNLSASQFIREIRLQKAAEMLRETELTASEISFEVGFSNPSYFTKCYREYYGYPPGETKTKKQEESNPEQTNKEEETKKAVRKNKNINRYIIAITIISIIAIIYFFKDQFTSFESKAYKEKSVAFLPFKNLSEDNSNLYFINGVMESSLNNLQKIKDLRVISRTSTEKYRNNPKNVSEIAEELQVNYLIEGSGQKIGNEVLLSIQLIDANEDSPIWSEQYKYVLDDIFELQNNIAKKIALAIEANVTPKEFALIAKKPTENLVAYDFYLKGLEHQNEQSEEGLRKGILNFEKAIEEDSKYADAYAQIAICYFYLDENKIEKKYVDKLNEYADNALLYDATSELPLIAKALYYINVNEFKLAIPYLEKALDYNPNASSVVLFLSVLYSRVVPNTSKYLTYALQGIKLNIEANDSVSKSYIYLNLSNALVQNGFTKKASEYIEESLKYNPRNPYSTYLKNFINYANNKDLKTLTSKMLIEWQKDTTRTDITQELAKMYYFQEDYDNALFYYEKYINILATNKIDLYPAENIKIAHTFNKMGFSKKAEQYLSKYKDYLEKDESIYKEASLAMLYLYENMPDKAIEAYDKFSLQDGFQYWVILFMNEDPLLKKLKNHPKYEETIEKIEIKFWEKHKKLKENLEKEKLL
ncbi:helix-turn-helix domain-containing protein [Aquimarina sp. AD1]|uniref:helix-turn-helix domain-containing protein n=1 Tax=Aquimarina sp. (strain AD1) TaxID=1714848 RepID=UPI000E5571D6|nr:helix-turn-helix domain-containing protein [Aquimarina sp. AD1]AXT55218.1 helix-turn-helix domain-containing protein [Aquimarina sp. AD1]RKN17586.1 helix-turn-helix domain-containing protein [Aquimarina sp. AD1]